MPFGRQNNFEPRPAEVSAAETQLSNEYFLPYNLDIVVFYGGHTDKKDFRSLVPYLTSADIFVPEFTNWTPEEVSLFSRISQGDKSAQSELARIAKVDRFNPYTRAEIKWLMGSGVYVTPIDYAASHDGADRIINHFENWGLLDKVVPSFDKSLDAIDRYAREEGEIEDYREDIMLRSIGPRLRSLIDNSPELNAKDRLRVVIQQGAAHTFFYHRLTEMIDENPTCTATRVFDKPMPIIFEHFDRLARSHRAGIELSKNDRRELAMKALARVGLRFFDRGGIPLVIYPGESRLRPVPPEEMVERIEDSTIRDFHKRVVASNKRT